ncbi:hypothetical protein HZC00_02555 [Candidatus Kaiserbacteria bacterium]|nr:hypothetical protein [Candidatus Kaiserbacteria bacterium]
MRKKRTQDEVQKIATERKLSRRQAGFTLLLAALAASIALTLGSSIFSIATKEVQLSSIGRDSQFAFYAADSAAECALYWDIRYSYFSTSTPPDPQNQYTCNGIALNAAGRPAANNPTPYPYTMTFQIEPNGYCANVSVLKCDGPISSNGTCTHASPPSIRTVVRADGFNTTCNKISTSRDALQRSVELNF